MDALSTCTSCDTPIDLEDNFCRMCGVALQVVQQLLPPPAPEPATMPTFTRRESALSRRPSSVPAPVVKAAAAVAIGTALQFGASMAGRYLIRRATGAALQAVTPSRKVAARPRREQKADERGDEPSTVTETVVFQRVWLRRD